jgi:tetratricopeptide (TPR) repeat protein
VVAQTTVAVPAIAAWRDEESRIRRVVEVRPSDTDALLGLADLLSTLGRAQEAREWIARAAGQGGAEADVALASLEYRSGHFADALAAAERAAAVEPANLAAGVIACARWRTSLVHPRRWWRAKRCWPHTRTKPLRKVRWRGVARGRRSRARSAVARGRVVEAPRRCRAGLGPRACRDGHGRRALGEPAFERVVTALPESYEGWLGVADMRSRLGDSTGAAAALTQAESMPASADGRARILRGRPFATLRGRARRSGCAPTARLEHHAPVAQHDHPTRLRRVTWDPCASGASLLGRRGTPALPPRVIGR